MLYRGKDSYFPLKYLYFLLFFPLVRWWSSQCLCHFVQLFLLGLQDVRQGLAMSVEPSRQSFVSVYFLLWSYSDCTEDNQIQPCQAFHKHLQCCQPLLAVLSVQDVGLCSSEYILDRTCNRQLSFRCVPSMQSSCLSQVNE